MYTENKILTFEMLSLKNWGENIFDMKYYRSLQHNNDETTYLVLNAKLHQRPGVTTSSSVIDPKPCNPFLVLFVSHNRHLVALLLQPFPQRDVWLHIATRADRQAHKVPRGHGQKDIVGRINRLGKKCTDDAPVP